MPTPSFITGLDRVRSKWGWFLALGLMLVVAGFIAAIYSWMAAVVAVIFLGWILVFTGVMEAIGAFQSREWGGFFLHLLGATLDLVLGVLFITRPVEGAAVLTLVLAAFFFVGGIFRLVVALDSRFPGWGWFALGGLVNIALAVLLIVGWPEVSWFIGFAVGIEMIFRGWFWIMLAMALKQWPSLTSDTRAPQPA